VIAAPASAESPRSTHGRYGRTAKARRECLPSNAGWTRRRTGDDGLVRRRRCSRRAVSGRVQTHSGKAAIRNSFRDQWKNPVPDLKLILNRVDLDGPLIRAEWTCTSPAFPRPMRGYDLFTVDPTSKIKRLEIIVTEAPMPPQ